MHSFQRDKKMVGVQARVRFICDVTTPNLPPLQGSYRANNRQNRTLPVLIAPQDLPEPLACHAAFALTKDICDTGMSVVATEACRLEKVVVAFWIANPHVDAAQADPILFHATVEHSDRIGGGFWQTGLSFVEVNDSRQTIRRIRALAKRLLPVEARQTVDC